MKYMIREHQPYTDMWGLVKNPIMQFDLTAYPFS